MSVLRPGLMLVAAVLTASCSHLPTYEERLERSPVVAPDSLALDFDPTDAGPTLRLALVRPATWDPIQVSLADQGAVIVADLLFDGLTESTADGRLVPGLATGWSPTEDGFAWTFALDTNRTSADAVRASFDRLRADAPDSAAAALLSSVVRIDVVDPATVRFVLSAPNAGFAWILSGLPFSIADDAGTPSGRFDLVEDDSSHSVLVSGVGDDSLSVLVDWVADDATALAAASAGTADGAVVPVDESERAAQDAGTQASARSIVRFYELDPTSPVFADIRTRQAVLAAVDASTLIDALATPAYEASGVVAATTAGFSSTACGVPCTVDTERATALVAEIGPLPVIRIGFTGEREKALAEAIAEQLGVVGLAAEPVEIAAGELSSAIASSTVDMFPYGWIAPAGSIDAVLPPLLAATSGVNPLGLVTTEIEQTLSAATVTTDDAARWELLQDAHRQALDHAVLLPVAVAQSRFVVSPAFSDVLTRADGSIEIRSLP